jgi:hypothetical protein
VSWQSSRGVGKLMNPGRRYSNAFARLVHHCHIVTIRGNSYRMRQHTELWQALHATQEPDSTPTRRRRNRQEVPTT